MHQKCQIQFGQPTKRGKTTCHRVTLWEWLGILWHHSWSLSLSLSGASRWVKGSYILRQRVPWHHQTTRQLQTCCNPRCCHAPTKWRTYYGKNNRSCVSANTALIGACSANWRSINGRSPCWKNTNNLILFLEINRRREIFRRPHQGSQDATHNSGNTPLADLQKLCL